MRQRAVIAMAMAGRPKLIIADEPTTALDVTVQAQVLSVLARRQAETGAAVILITHDLGVVAEVAHRVAVMYGGRIVETGPVEEIFKRPRHPYTVALLQSMPRIDASDARLDPDSRPAADADATCRRAARSSRAARSAATAPHLHRRGPAAAAGRRRASVRPATSRRRSRRGRHPARSARGRRAGARHPVRRPRS